ncbi:MAG: hypothetical protein H6745_10345 [Deltaproteobacteria bacterium]|nr:hypothetical protein [Deltaproteobacteria bacterium]
MKPHALIDLYVPAHAGTPQEVADAAREAGLDAIVLVADSPDELPEQEEIDAVNAAGDGPHVHVACAVAGLGYRVAVLAPGGFDGMSLDAIEASADVGLIQAAAKEYRGCAISVCPRQGQDGLVHRQVVALPAEPAIGVVAMVTGGARLARDLDIEDAGVAGRRILGATGPFGALGDVGRYATLLPAAAAEVGSIIQALLAGKGVAVELIPSASRKRRGGGGGGGGGQAQDGDKPKKRRRRRRRRGGGGGDEGGGGGDGE